MSALKIPLHVQTLVDAWKASGRTAFIYPRKKQVSLNGFPGIPYREAAAKITACLYPPRVVKHPHLGDIEVKGTGAATYWRRPGDTTSPFAGSWLLASPNFRKSIEQVEAGQ